MSLKIIRRKGRPTYYIKGTVTVWRDGTPHAQRIYRSARTDSRSQAEGIVRQIEGRAVEAAITGRDRQPTFAEAVITYLDAGGSARFLEKPTRALGEWPIDRIDQATLDAAGRKAYPSAQPATLRRQWHGPILAVMRAAGLDVRFRRPKDGARRTHFITPKIADKVISAAAAGRRPSPWGPALVTFLFGQGARIGEALALDSGDIDLDHGMACLRDTKNGHERWVTLCPRTMIALTTLPNLGQPGPIFRRPDGRPYKPRDNRGGQIRAMASRCTAAAGLDPAIYTPHTFRHSWATWFYSQTRDVVRLKQEGGWRSGEWERYVQISRASLGEEARACGWDYDGAQHNTKSLPRRAKK